MGSSVDQYAVFGLLLIASFHQVPALITFDSGCGSTKGCFPDCYNGCSYLVTWADTGSNIQFTMSVEESETNVYLAVAFSDDYRMGDDSVVSCLVPSTGTRVYSYFNEGTESEELSPATLGLSATSVSHANGVITCTFTRDYSAADSKFFDLRNDYYIQLVVGEAEEEDGSYKMEHHEKIPWFSDKKVDFQSNEIVGAYKLNSPLVKLHSIMMLFAWLLFSLVGIITARYNKDMLPETKLFGTKVWFQLHRGVMIVMIGCLVIGFIPIFVEIQGYSQIPSGGVSKAHPVLGIIIFILAFLNPIGALLRPGPDHQYRWVFNWAHFGVGLITQLLAILTVFFGYVLERSELSNASPITTGVQLAVLAIFVIALEVHKWFGRNKGSTVDFQMAVKGEGVEEKKPTEQKNPKKSSLPFIALIIFAVVMLGFVLGVLGIIASG